MADYATKQDVQEIVGKAVDDLSSVINQLAQSMHNEIQEIRTDIADLREGFDRLQNTLDAFLKRLDDVEKDNAARDLKLAKLEAWAEKVAAKTGVKLEF